jgi:PKD repeat protein
LLNEGDTFAGSGSFTDPGADMWTATVNYGDVAGVESLTLNPDKTFALNHTYLDDGDYAVEVCVSDDDSGIGCDMLTVSVANIAPVIETLLAPINPMQVGATVETSAVFTDPGILDSHAATWDWGDGSTSEEAVDGYNVSGSHAYETPGVYTLSLTVTDDDGGADTTTFQYVVIYDPEGGFVTGGGWITSPLGAYTPDPSLTGKATFGFVSRYQKGATVPSGSTEFQFHIANLNFKSTSYDWLVIAGSKAKYKGTGTINGAGEYGFMLTAIDGAPDRFRIKIWDKATGEVVYDNQPGAAEDADPVTVIGGGSIVIHKEK